ncbi:MAG: hypothetical protein PF551_05410, partial [Candidatus Marinimicrobia bacterium]|nr:hypothetical protein [Candidatus Neomarinimicrobiota bacterium]
GWSNILKIDNSSLNNLCNKLNELNYEPVALSREVANEWNEKPELRLKKYRMRKLTKEVFTDIEKRRRKK